MQIAFLLYDGFTALDVVGPYDVLRNLPGCEPVFVAEQVGPVRNTSGSLALIADKGVDEVDEADILVVPGGFGTRVVLDHQPLLAWLRQVHEGTTWTTSVCTGALLLAAAGLLEGEPATTHWLARSTLGALGARPVPERVVQSGKIITAAGVSAGIDMALRVVELTEGPQAAKAIQLGLEYDPQPPFDAGSPEKAPASLVESVTAAFTKAEAEVKAAARIGT